LGRWETHLMLLRAGKNTPHLQGAWDRYGEAAFVFEILETVGESRFLSEREGYYCETFKSYNRDYGYNLKIVSPNGSASYSDESRRKMAEAKLGKPGPMLGKSFTPEHREKLAAAKRGVKRGPRTKAVKEKISFAKKGTPRTPEDIQKMRGGQRAYLSRLADSGEPHPNKGRKHPFRPLTDEHKQKIAAAHVQRRSGGESCPC
jgi:group I intron endonuclease